MLILLCGGVAAARRRQLLEHDLHYGLDAWNERFVTRAAKVFEGKDHFHRRLFEHEDGLDDGRLQSFMVNLQPGIHPGADLRESLEARAKGDRHLEPRPRPPWPHLFTARRGCNHLTLTLTLTLTVCQ